MRDVKNKVKYTMGIYESIKVAWKDRRFKAFLMCIVITAILLWIAAAYSEWVFIPAAVSFIGILWFFLSWLFDWDFWRPVSTESVAVGYSTQ